MDVDADDFEYGQSRNAERKARADAERKARSDAERKAHAARARQEEAKIKAKSDALHGFGR